MLLDQVGAQQDPIIGAEQGGKPGEEVAPRLRVEVADRAAEEGDEASALAVGDALQVMLEVADQAADGEAGVLLNQRLRRLVGDLLRDIDRHVGPQAAGIAHCAQQVTGLRGRAGPELNQRPRRSSGGDDLGGAFGEDRALRPGRVVLG